ncbi:23S rRNA pseudouridine2605 synthase [Luteibacter rhizovicinus]|uniref:Pseudouridine synthase n=1 Tax=Luteibacter rhizovicinus TaxID=242606 RepID=A0A4R3YR43_9GAMM|nr:pseudouridine synthase [Luteibacter rhizovicinus]TCV94846.1 23S rRNA pseudouridine2605 synthase [Luteibacter rhizovicinus]
MIHKPSHPRKTTPTFGLARVLSKRGICSRSQAERLAREGRVTVNGRVVLDPEFPIAGPERIEVDGGGAEAVAQVYIMMNKPRGLVTTAADERGRDTVYTALAEAGLPWLGPVGRLDKASEGLLLLTNDTVWAAGITEPVTHVDKTYHVQVAGTPDEATLAAMREGVRDGDDFLRARHASLLRQGERNAWLEVTLDEGRNRHIRRLLAALGFDVVRLVRIAIGSLTLGELPKGQWRHLSSAEVDALRATPMSGRGAQGVSVRPAGRPGAWPRG